MTERRYGKFRISKYAFENDIDVCLLIMAQCVVMKCEFSYDMDAFDYIAYSPEFDIIPEGEVTPYYFVRFNRTEDGFKYCEFEKEII